MMVSKIIIILFVLVQISLAGPKESYKGVEEYRFNELWVLALAGGFQASGQWAITNKMNADFESANNQNLPSWESWQVGRNTPWAHSVSNYLLVLGAYPIYDAIVEVNGETAFYETVILAELLLINSGLNLWVRSGGAWPRPYYFDESRDRSNDKPEILGSFYSGHASSTFALAMAWYQIKKMRGDEGWENLVGFGVAVASSSLRVVAGKHYVVDVLMGALVGSVLGYHYPQFRIGDSPFKYWVMPSFTNENLIPDGLVLNVDFGF